MADSNYCDLCFGHFQLNVFYYRYYLLFFVAFRSIDDEEELLYGVTSIPRTVAFVKKPEERAPGK